MIDKILVSYNQICIFDAMLDEPFNDWTYEHVSQGFAWRPGSVSFGAVDNVETTIIIQRVSAVDADVDAFRVIAVPFTVNPHEAVVIGSIGDERQIEIEAGTYRLTFELGAKDERPWCRLSFIADSNPTPQIIKSDSEITKRGALLMSASPAA
jgi:hypothetical protein